MLCFLGNGDYRKFIKIPAFFNAEFSGESAEKKSQKFSGEQAKKTKKTCHNHLSDGLRIASLACLIACL